MATGNISKSCPEEYSGFFEMLKNSDTLRESDRKRYNINDRYTVIEGYFFGTEIIDYEVFDKITCKSIKKFFNKERAISFVNGANFVHRLDEA